jgi:hypothetical protein
MVMPCLQWSRRIAGIGSMITCLLTSATAVVAQGGPSPSARWNALTADITMRRYEVSVDGAPIGTPAPVVTYRWERAEAPWGWRTTMTLLSAERPKVLSLRGPVDINPHRILRIEDEGDGSPLRVIDVTGRPVPKLPPQLMARAVEHLRAANPSRPEFALETKERGAPIVAGREWIESFLAAPERSATRREALRRKFGNPVARDKGLDSYVSMSGANRINLLADPEAGVPLSMSVSRDGALNGHTMFAYTRRADSTLVRRSVRSQHRLANDTRAVTDIELTNVRLEQRRTR